MKAVSIVGAGLVVLVVAGLASAAPAPAPKAVPFVEFTDPAGDVRDQNGPGNDRDVVKARIEGDGSNILVSATLAQDEHGTSASAVLELYLDTDNKPETGGAAYWGRDSKPPKRGYEYLGKGLKSGHVIRISSREGAVAGEESFFPDALLALK